MVAGHLGCVVGSEFPLGQYSAFFIFRKQRVYEIVVQFWVNNREQGMKRTESIPKREDGIHRILSIALMRLVVHAEIASVYIGVEIGADCRVI